MYNYWTCAAVISVIALAAPVVDGGEPGSPAVVAQVLGRSVTLRDLDAGNVPNEAKGAAVDAEAIKRMRREKLRGLVWAAVFEDYAKQRRNEPTAAEIESNIRNNRRLQEEGALQRAKERTRLTQELQSPGLSDAQRKQP